MNISHTCRAAAGLLLLASPAIALGNDSDWTSLDAEIERLAATRPQGGGGFSVGGYLKTSYMHSSDIQVAPSGNDLSGFDFQAARVEFKGDVGDYQFKVSFEGTGAAATLKDAYADFSLSDAVQVRWGQFKMPFLFESVNSDTVTTFYDRSTQAGSWNGREPGVMLHGGQEQLAWYVAARNGGDGPGDEFLLLGRVVYTLMGDGVPKMAAGYGPEASDLFAIGVGYVDEGSISDGTAISVDAIGVTGPVAISAEVVDYDSGFTAGAVTAGTAAKASGRADTTPWAVSAAYAFSEMYEGVARYEDLDDANDTSLVWLGVNRYIAGHALKWMLSYVSTDSDAGDADVLQLGLNIKV